LRAVVEIDQEELILRVRGTEELHGGLARLVDLVGHASTHVEDDADGDGNVLAGELEDFLLDAIFEYAEILTFESRDEAAQGVGDGRADERHVRFGAEWMTFLDLGSGRRRNFGARGFLSEGGLARQEEEREGENRTDWR